MKKIFILLLSALTFSSCNNDLDINGELRETTIIYGLLNHGDTVQYLKIYKAFLTEENTIIAAGRPENLYYYDSIDVYIETVQDGNSTFFQRINFDTTTSIPKDPGVFSNPYQIIYRSKPGEPLLNKDSKYQVVVQNKYTGKKTTAITSLINITPNQNPYKWNGANLPNAIPTFNPFTTFRIEAPENAAQLEIIFEFYYLEKNRQTGVTTKKGPIVSRLLSTKNLKFNAFDDYQLSGNSFLISVEKNINYDPNIIRYDDTSSVVVVVGGKELIRYNEVNSPSLGIIEERPSYTNVSNGLGLVSCRFHHRYPKVTLNRRAIDSLKFSIQTSHLGFYID
jgi:hypothetical protein